MTKLYYTAPSDEVYADMKKASTEVWESMDNTYGYVDKKMTQVKRMENVQDNFMYLFAMFDMGNQRKVVEKLSDEAKTAVRERMVDGGNDEYMINQLGL